MVDSCQKNEETIRLNASRIIIFLWIFLILLSCTDRVDEELRRAAIKGNEDQVKSLIKSGAEVNFKHGGWTVLMFAAREGNLRIAEVLVENAADINAKGREGETALTISAEGGHVEVAKVLLTKGANVNARTDHGNTALMYSAQYGHPRFVKLLLDSGADVKLKDKDGDTALSLAKLKGHHEIVQLLKNVGATE